MGLMTSISDFFKSKPASAGQDHDKYGVLDPIMGTIELIKIVKTLVLLYQDQWKDLLAGLSGKSPDVVTAPGARAGYQAFGLYIKGLPATVQTGVRRDAGAHLIQVLDALERNLQEIERHHVRTLQDSSSSPDTMRVSSLIMMGYIEKSETYATWVTYLMQSLVDTNLTPYQLSWLSGHATDVAKFAGTNIQRWIKPEYLIKDISSLKSRGLDVAIKNQDVWVDQLLDDRSFSETEQSLLSAGIINPIAMIGAVVNSVYQWRIDLCKTRREWLITRISMLEAKSRGLDETSPEYRQLRQALEKYSNQVSNLEQKIHRG